LLLKKKGDKYQNLIMKETIMNLIMKYIFILLAPWREYAFQIKSVVTLFLRNYNIIQLLHINSY